ncbi:hypothetical protein SAMN05216603_11410 [Pseudomonas benzenivorans]|nr:GNAT family N-acetyltransferase [Pseudomonas benzenivorans]SDH79675.1 hypothetical protein SAMN05216603_11410 [Pseudomonas benzenivorans]
MDLRLLHGPAITPHIEDLARLRIEVFREFPYLYDGSLEYEAEYLQTYARSPDSLFVLVLDHERVVGASTGLPLSDEIDEFKQPFIEAGVDIERIFYFGESVLLPEYRGHGLGVGFFAKREGYARRLGRFDFCVFSSVERPLDHPRRPPDYQPLDEFWHHRGYQHLPQLRTELDWQDLDESSQSPKPMSFWIKDIRP